MEEVFAIYPAARAIANREGGYSIMDTATGVRLGSHEQYQGNAWDDAAANIRASLPPQAAPAQDEECAATGTSCSYGPHGPKGAIQCRYCGASPEKEEWLYKDGYVYGPQKRLHAEVNNVSLQAASHEKEKTAVGEGELPENLDDQVMRHPFADRYWYPKDEVDPLWARAIAQRDEASKELEQARADLSQNAFIADVASSDVVSDRLHVIPALRKRAEAAEAKLAAAPEFKPEEIERLENILDACDCPDDWGFNEWIGARAAAKVTLSRLRSLPSEPQLENRKPGEV
jgi:hypothetical protein